MTETPAPDAAADSPQARLLAAALPHVVFDGWSDATLRAAARDAGLAEALARALFPRGGVDMAAAWHRQTDARMVQALAAEDLSALRFRERIARAIRLRLELIEDKEPVRRASALFALPQHAGQGAQLIWGTADAIWTALGDSDRDFAFWTKRATLSGVYAATVLYWLGDDSPGHQATWDFLDRRIEDVMRIETAKAAVRGTALGRAVMDLPDQLLRRLPRGHGWARPQDMPGRTAP